MVMHTKQRLQGPHLRGVVSRPAGAVSRHLGSSLGRLKFWQILIFVHVSEGTTKVAALLLHRLVNQREQLEGAACPQAGEEEEVKPQHD